MNKNLMKKKNPTSFLFDEGKIPPQAVDLEESVLGAILQEPQCYKKIISILTVESFYKIENQIIYKSIQELQQKRIPSDLLIVKDDLYKKSELEQIGGPLTLTNLIMLTQGSKNIEFHARIIQQKYIQREVIRICSEHIRSSYNDTEDVDDILISIENEIRNLSNTFLTQKKRLSIKEVSTLFLNSTENYEENQYIWETGHKLFDQYVSITKDKILMIAGAAKHGKSRFVSALMYNLLEKYPDIAIYWVTLEDSAKDILINYLSSKIFIKSKQIKLKNYDESYIPLIEQFVQKFSTFDIEFIEKSAKSYEIRSNFFDFCKLRKNKLCILIIDNILSLDDRIDFRANENSMYDFIMMEILKTRQETGGLIIPIHHYKDAQQEESKIEKAYRPILSDMKGTEAFRRTPNQVLLLNNPWKYKDLANEYRTRKDLLKYLFICDTGANRDETSDDDKALIRFLASLDFCQFEEL